MDDMTLEQAIVIIRQKGGYHEWLWRLVVNHGYKYREIEPEVLSAMKYWDKNVNKSSKTYKGRKKK